MQRMHTEFAIIELDGFKYRARRQVGDLMHHTVSYTMYEADGARYLKRKLKEAFPACKIGAKLKTMVDRSSGLILIRKNACGPTDQEIVEKAREVATERLLDAVPCFIPLKSIWMI